MADTSFNTKWLFSSVFGGVGGNATVLGPSSDLRPGDVNDVEGVEYMGAAATIWPRIDTFAPSLVITTFMGVVGGLGSVR